MSRIFFLVIFSCLFYFEGRTQKKADVTDSLTRSHRVIAIMPAIIKWDLRKGEQKKFSEEQVREAEMKMGFMVQSYLSQQLIKKADDYHYHVALQTAPRSNNILFAGGLSYADYSKLSADSVAKLLGADAVLLAEGTVSRTFDEDLALAFRVINAGIFPGNARIGLKLKIIDRSNGSVVWQRDFLPEDYSAASIEKSLEKIVKKAAKVLPYRD